MLVGSQVDPWTRSPHTHTYRDNKSVSSRSQTIPTQTFIISSTNKFVPITGLVMGIIELQTTQKTGWTMTKTNSQEYLLKFLSNRIPRVDETYVFWGVDKRPLCWSFELSPWSVDRCFKMYCYILHFTVMGRKINLISRRRVLRYSIYVSFMFHLLRSPHR